MGLLLWVKFRPSPCSTHYGGRWATMPSADICPISRDVAIPGASVLPPCFRYCSGGLEQYKGPFVNQRPLG